MQKLQLDLLSNKQQLCWNRLKPTYVTTLVGVSLFVTFPSQTIYNDGNLQTKHIKKIHVHLFCYYNFLSIIIFSWWYFTPKAYLEWCDIILKACIENFAEIDSNKTITWRFFFTIELIFTWQLVWKKIWNLSFSLSQLSTMNSFYICNQTWLFNFTFRLSSSWN